MAKKWNDFTRREKNIGVMVAVFAVFTLGGISSAMNGGAQPSQVAPEPVTTYQEVQETEAIPFTKETKEDGARVSGETVVTTAGVDGVKTKTYKITLVDGKETSRELLKEETTTEPVTEITSVGTYVAPVVQKPAARSTAGSGCDPNYSGACVPVASDVDCAGGSGNGPAYVSGPVYVVGSDIYGLDRDGDGVGCE